MKQFSLCILLFGIALIGQAQTFSSNVSIRNNKGVKAPFTLKVAPNLTITNNKLNIAIISTQNELLELNGIDIKLIKNILLSTTQFNIALIQPQQTWLGSTTDKKSTIEIKCNDSKEGSPIIIYINTKIYNGSNYYMVRATIKGKIPSKNYQITNQ